MKGNLFALLISLIFGLALNVTVSFAQGKPVPKEPTYEEILKMDKGKNRPPSGPKFEVIFAEGTKANYIVLLHGEDRTTVQNLFHTTELELMEAVILEAKKFGLTEEAVGGAKPIITRFSEPKLNGFFIDVSKIANRTRFYVTLKGSNRALTIDAGTIKRNEQKKENEESEPIFFDSLMETIRAARR